MRISSRSRLAAVSRALGKLFGADLGPDLMLLLTYGRALDTTRMRVDLGFEPRFTTREAFVDMVSARGLRPLVEPGAFDAISTRIASLAGGLDAVVDALGTPTVAGRG